MQYMTMLFN